MSDEAAHTDTYRVIARCRGSDAPGGLGCPSCPVRGGRPAAGLVGPSDLSAGADPDSVRTNLRLHGQVVMIGFHVRWRIALCPVNRHGTWCRTVPVIKAHRIHRLAA